MKKAKKQQKKEQLIKKSKQIATKAWLAAFAAGMALSGLVATVSADTVTINPSSGGYTLQSSFGSIIGNAIQIVYTLAAILLLAYLLWGGIDWITAGGDKGKVETAVAKIRNALIGLVIVASSWAIFRLALQVVFGADNTIVKDDGTVDLKTPNF